MKNVVFSVGNRNEVGIACGRGGICTLTCRQSWHALHCCLCR